MAKRDYYEVLGLDKSASDQDIKKAFRRVAMKHHPDRNPEDESAGEKFKEAQEAYEVLGDGDKKAAYDRFGHAGVDGNAGAGGGFDSSGFGDMFGDVFGDIFGGGGRRSGPRASTTAAKNIAKYIAEHITETRAIEAATSTGISIYTCVTKTIISRLFITITEHFVGFLGFFELFACTFVFRVSVWVMFHRHATKGLLNILVRSRLIQSQNFIIIAFCHS